MAIVLSHSCMLFMGKRFIVFVCVFALVGMACSTTRPADNSHLPPYSPSSRELHDTIARMDSLLFSAYNSCQAEVFASLIAEDIEFYHDQGGLTTSKPELLQAFKKNICGRVTRELLKGSTEVYPIPNYGAVQMGAHRFYNKEESERGPSRFSKFVHTWHRENGQWKLARVISLH